MTTSTDANGTTVWGYDAYGRPANTTAPDGTTQRYIYDNAGRLDSIAGPESTTITDNFTGSGPPDAAKWTTSTTGSGTANRNANVMSLQSSWGGGGATLRSKLGNIRDSDQTVSVGFLSTSTFFLASLSLTARTQLNGDGYRLEIPSDSWNARVVKRVNGTDTTLGTVGVPLGSPIRARLVVDGTKIKAKAWAVGASEPSAWALDTQDTALPNAGANNVNYTSNTTNTAAVDDYTIKSNPSTSTFVAYQYDNDNKLVAENYANGSRDYDYHPTTGRLTELDQSLPGATSTTGFAYDPAGQVASTATNGITTSYSYDQASQLTGVTPSSGTGTQAFTYDHGRIKTATIDGVTTTNTYDVRSRLLSAASSSGSTTNYTYNAAGDRTGEATGANTTAYAYDPAGRLSSTQHANAGTTTKTVARTYNGDGLLGKYDVTGPGGAPAGSHGIRWDTNRGVPLPLQLTNTSTPAATNLANGVNEAEAILVDNAVTPIAVDGFNSPIASTGQSINYGTRYDAWGQAASPSTSNAPKLGYRGELTIDGQTYLRNRTYDNRTRQFTTVDPAGPVVGSPTMATAYHYVDNDPINLIDPLGLAPSDRNPMDDSWNYLESENEIGGVDDFVEGILAQAFGNVWGAVTGIVQVGGGALSCAGEKLNGVWGIGSLIPDSASCDGIEATIGAIGDFGAELWTSVSQLFTHHDQKAFSYFVISLGEVLTGSNMGDCLLTPYDDHDNYRTYAYCIGTYIGGGLVNLVAAGLTKAGLDRLRSSIVTKADDAIARTSALTGTVWDDVVATSPPYPGTHLPKSLVLGLDDGTRVWLHPNATKHIAERVTAGSASGPISVQSQLRSLQAAISEANRRGVSLGQMYRVGGWELQFGIRASDELVVVNHARYLG